MNHNIQLLRYKWRTGMIAWMLHRLTGLGLMFYLTLHIFVTRSLHDAAMIKDPLMRTNRFADVYSLLSHPLFGVLEVALLGAVLYHALNGVRVLAVDYFGGARYHKTLFYVLAGVWVVLMLVFGGLMAMRVLGHAGGAA